MNNHKNIWAIANAMYDHLFVTIPLADGRSVKGRISDISDISFSIGLNPRNRNRVRIELVESVKLHWLDSSRLVAPECCFCRIVFEPGDLSLEIDANILIS